MFSDIFSLPMPALWTVVAGDWDRSVEELSEQRVPVENILVHEHFNNYNNDIGKSVSLTQICRTSILVWKQENMCDYNCELSTIELVVP